MIAALKDKIWGILRDQDVSLVMIVAPDGRILWRRGRRVLGTDISTGEGFSKTALSMSGQIKSPNIEENAVVQLFGADLSRSARGLMIKSILVMPLSDGFFLYIDSGTREGFASHDISLFQTLGDLLSGHLGHIQQSQEMPGGIVGESAAIVKVRKLVTRYAIEEDPVLLMGETGVGKTHAAEQIHLYSGRKGRLITIHTPSIPETLFESELFGCRKGAYSGAVDSRKGLVAEAEGGTLFLDEISEIPANVQAKLLSFIERKVYRPVGESRELSADVRIIAAGNRVLKDELAAGRFRQDLFYRLNALPIQIPPLRERREDIAPLVHSFAHLLRGALMDDDCMAMLKGHDWPGNVRELMQVLKRCGVMSVDLRPREALREILAENGKTGETGAGDDLAIWNRYETEMASGQTFWQGLWQDFIDRHLNQAQLRGFLKLRFKDHDSLKELAEGMNITPEEYPRFVSALHKYGIHPLRSDD